jgi:hypothetical protein
MDGNKERSARGATVEAGENDAKRAKMMQDAAHAADQVWSGRVLQRETRREDRVRKRSETRNKAREKEQSGRGRERITNGSRQVKSKKEGDRV